jgi:hypothetical protein
MSKEQSDYIRRPAFAWIGGQLRSMVNHKYSPLDVHDMPASCADLDLLTPFYKSKFEGMGKGEQDLIYTIIALHANYPLGQKFSVASLTADSAKHSDSNLVAELSKPHISAALGRLEEKNIIESVRNAETGKLDYSFRHPSFEIWMRGRVLGMSDYYAFFNKTCPVLLEETTMTQPEFWQELCKEADVKMPVLPLRRRSPNPEMAKLAS